MTITPHNTTCHLVAVSLLLCIASPAAAADRTLLPIDAQLDVRRLDTQDATPRVAQRDGRQVLRLQTGHASKWPGITIRPTEGTWDLSGNQYVATMVRNAGEQPVEVGMRVDSQGQGGKPLHLQRTLPLSPGQQGELVVMLYRKMPPSLAKKLFGMRGYPGMLHPDRGINPAKTDKVLVFVNQPKRDHVIEIGDLRAGGHCQGATWLTGDLDDLFPMIDRFGQYIHKDWPEKTKSESELKQRSEAEQADLAAQPGPPDWDQYGGWQAGPQRKATGHFRVEEYAGKWWLVDPAGRLFWSHGTDCVRPTTAYTPITDRKFYFAGLPDKQSPLAVFYGRTSWAPHGYYQDKAEFETFNFTGANLYRKYGPDWHAHYNDLCHQRLRSWGLNTIANWSDSEVYRQQRTPYVVTLGSGRSRIEGSSGYWGKFPDPFDPEFAATTRRNATRQKEAAGSPWCVGVFVDNELAWGDELSLAVATLASPPKQAAKQQFLADLKAKYGSIEDLNRVWKTSHGSWQSLLESQTPPERQPARDDLARFYSRVAEQYFRVCRDAVKEAAPHTLYLGCRFAWVNDQAVRAAAQFCDVIGMNKYRYSVADVRLPDGVDAPVIIGEFHFGALDRGMFHTGLRSTKNQTDRAAAYTRYVRGALDNRLLVGTHWFQFGDQATTGRGDGENYQIGLLDVCDTPYGETIQATRQIGVSMYRERSQP